MNCHTARPLVPLYVDGELGESQSHALRPHLLECPACRAVAQEQKTLKAWFVPSAPIAVPEGFAARVARRAIAGDTGEGFEFSSREEQQGSVTAWVLQAVAVAALLLITLSIAIRRQEIPQSPELKALEARSLAETVQALDELNRAEDAPDARGGAREDEGTGE